MFKTCHNIDRSTSLFIRLTDQVVFEDFSDTRKGAILVAKENEQIPIVRTTTAYKNSLQEFTPAYRDLMSKIQKTFIPSNESSVSAFNNAMVEIYEPSYTKMKFHSDQALDLAPDSHICIFSCYEDENEPNPRRLITKNKESGDVTEIPMLHDSCIIFSTSTNQRFLHKIVGGSTASTSRWLGITLRVSKTFVYEKDNESHFVHNNSRLTIANETERKQFFEHKALENKKIQYEYPEISYKI